MLELPRPASPATRRPDFPRGVGSTVLLVEYAASRGLAQEAALRGSGLTAADLADPDRQVTAEQELRVVRNLLVLVPREEQAAAGREVGRRYHVSTFGIFGFALLSSPTVLDAVDVALRFWDLSFAFALPEAHLEGDAVVFSLSTTGVPADVQPFVLARDAAAVETVLDELLPGEPAPRFEPGTHRLPLPAAYLSRALPQGNPGTLAVCRAMCEDVVMARRARSGLAQRVRVLVTQRVAAGAAMEAVASDLGMSGRTLRRRLAEEGTSYQALLDEVRESLALEMLGTGRLPVEDVALRLGYAEASSFIHAFRRWRGTTPAAHQRALREAGDPD